MSNTQHRHRGRRIRRPRQRIDLRLLATVLNVTLSAIRVVFDFLELHR